MRRRSSRCAIGARGRRAPRRASLPSRRRAGKRARPTSSCCCCRWRGRWYELGVAPVNRGRGRGEGRGGAALLPSAKRVARAAGARAAAARTAAAGAAVWEAGESEAATRATEAWATGRQAEVRMEEGDAEGLAMRGAASVALPGVEAPEGVKAGERAAERAEWWAARGEWRAVARPAGWRAETLAGGEGRAVGG